MDSFQIIFATISFPFYLVFFSKSVVMLCKGIKVIQMCKGDKTTSAKITEVLITIFTTLYGLIQIALLVVPEHLYLLPIPDYIRYVGSIGLLSPIILAVSVITMSDSWRQGIDNNQKTSMITNGIYKYSRNPAYVAFDLMYVGCFLLVPSVYLLVLSIIQFILLHLQILHEEKLLPKIFGSEYLDYKKRTPRYICIKLG